MFVSLPLAKVRRAGLMERFPLNTSLGCHRQSPLMGAIAEIGQSNPVERVGEKRGHTSLLGQP